MVDTKRRIALVTLIIVLVIVNVLLFYNGINLECGKCVIKFTNKRVSGVATNFPTIEIGARELYDEWVEGKCPIKWDRNRGFYELA